MIVEMRTYKTKPGMREEFLEIFKSKRACPPIGRSG